MFLAYIHVRFKHAMLGTHVSYWCSVILLAVTDFEREESRRWFKDSKPVSHTPLAYDLVTGKWTGRQIN